MTKRVHKRRALPLLIPLAVLLVVVVPPSALESLTFHHWLHSLTAGLVIAALPGAIAFPLMYAQVRWWETHLGRAVLMMAVGIGGVIVLASMRVFAQWPEISNTYEGDPIQTDLVRLVVFLWLFIAIHYKLYALWSVSRRGKDLHTDDAEVRAQHRSDEAEAAGVDDRC